MRRVSSLVGFLALSACIVRAPGGSSPSATPTYVSGAGHSRSPSASPLVRGPDDVDRLQEAAIDGTRAFDLVRSLTDDVRPRLAGSANDKAAVAWALKTLAAQGFTNVHAERVMVPRWERGAEAAEIVSPSLQPLLATALGCSVATPAGGVTEAGMKGSQPTRAGR